MKYLILVFALFVLCGLPAFAIDPPAEAPAKTKTFAEPLYRWVDEAGVEHIEPKSKVPFVMFAKNVSKPRLFCRWLRRVTTAWVVPVLNLAGGIRSAFGS
jgi:hypothetical protein